MFRIIRRHYYAAGSKQNNDCQKEDMMRICSTVILVVLLVSFGPWVAPGTAQQDAKELASVLEQCKKAQSAIADFTADIKQVKKSSLME